MFIKVLSRVQQTYTHINVRDGVREAERYKMKVPLSVYLNYIFVGQEVDGLDVVFVIDRSGSMGNKPGTGWGGTATRLGAVKETLKILTEKLRPADRGAVIAFDDKPQAVCPLVSGSELSSALSSIPDPGNSTNIGLALRAAKDLLRARTETKAAVVVLLTDGFAGRQRHDSEAKSQEQITAEYGQDAVAAAEEISEAGFDVAALGFGDEYDGKLLARIALSKPSVRYIDSRAKAESAFSEVIRLHQETVQTQIRISAILNVENFQWHGAWHVLPDPSFKRPITPGKSAKLGSVQAAEWSFPLLNVGTKGYGVILAASPEVQTLNVGSVPVGEFWLTRMGKPWGGERRRVMLEVTDAPIRGMMTGPHNPDDVVTKEWLRARRRDLCEERDTFAQLGKKTQAVETAELIKLYDEKIGDSAQRVRDEDWLEQYRKENGLANSRRLVDLEHETSTTPPDSESNFYDGMTEDDVEAVEVDERTGKGRKIDQSSTRSAIDRLRNRTRRRK